MKSSRNTFAKTQILGLIHSSENAFSHSDIQTALDGLCDRVTIYRILERLLNEGQIHKVVNIDGVVKYAACNNCSIKHQHNHAHFNCQICRSLTCLEDVIPNFELPKNYKVSEINFTLSGVCPKCI